MLTRKRKRRVVVALLAAYAVALQALLASIGLGSAAGPLAFDPFTASICTSGTVRHSPDAPVLPTGHGHAGCCVLCAVPGLAAVDFDVARVIFARLAPAFLIRPSEAMALFGTIAQRPCQPRAPPQLA